MTIEDLSGERQIVPLEEWLNVLHREYLADYIKLGGSAVKVVSGSPESLQEARCRIQEMAEQEGHYYAFLDPAEPDAAGKRPDLHRIEKFFFAVTRDVDWRGWAAAQARKYLADQGVYIREGRSLNDVDGIAADNGRTRADLLNQYQCKLATPQILDHGMGVEFRTAVTALGLAQLIPEHITPTTEEVLLAWFAGRTMPGAANTLKRIHIFERIQHTNARHIFASFCRWLPRTGHSGLVVVLDFRPYEHKRIFRTQRQAQTMQRIQEAIARRASHEELARIAEGEAEPAITYSDAAYMRMLTMIRHFIDEIDWFERFLLIVLTTPKFYDSTSPRNYNQYDALQTRIGLEVRDTRKANPAASLVHLGGSA